MTARDMMWGYASRPRAAYATACSWGEMFETVRYEKVVQVVVQHIEVFCCDHCGAKYKEWTTKCPNCGALLSGRKEVL